MGFKTVFIRDSEKLRLYLDNLIVDTKDGEISFLISDLKYLIIDNNKSTLSVRLINKLTENNVALVLCDLSHHPCTQLLPINSHFASSGMMFKQIKWDEHLKSLLQARIIQEKIQSQIYILKRNCKSISVIAHLEGFKGEVQDGDATNREGLAAKMYFREMFGDNFVRFNDDIANAGLNYGYAIFRSLIEAIIVSKGLVPNLGIFHKGVTNGFNLADDVIEIYRPLVDDYVLNNLMNEDMLKTEHKQELIKLTDLKIEYKGQMNTISNTIEMFIESIIRCFETNSLDDFVPPSLIRIDDI